MHSARDCTTYVEKPVLENVTGKTRRVYIWSRSKMAALGYVYTLGKQTSCSPKHCMSRNATSIKFLEVPIFPCVLMYDWDL